MRMLLARVQALDEEEAKLMSALRATWADYRDSIRKEVESKTGAIDAYKARLDQLAAALGRSQSGVHAQLVFDGPGWTKDTGGCLSGS